MAVLVFKEPFFYLIMPPYCKSNDAGNSNMLKRNHNVLPLSEKAKVLNLVKKEKNAC